MRKPAFWCGSALIFACFFIPIIPGIFVCGYIFAVMRQAAHAEKSAMPAWTDWGKLFVDGLKVTLVQLLLTLPAGLVYTVGMLAYFGSVMVVSISSSGHSGDLAALIPMLIAMAVFFFSLFFGSLLLLLGLIPLPAALACMAERDSLSGAFAIGHWTRALMRNKLGYFLAWVVMMGLYAMVLLWPHPGLLLCHPVHHHPDRGCAGFILSWPGLRRSVWAGLP